MRVISLQSGSNGNSVYVEADGVRLLFDAGISGKQAELRLASHGRDIRRVDGVLISHDHSDHARSMGIFQRKFGLPLHVTGKTLEVAARRCRLGRIDTVHHFEPTAVLRFRDVSVETIPTPHDGADGVAFVVDDGRHRLGILTDLGHVFDGLESLIGSLDAILIESNYDPRMLADGDYPDFLKERITGPGGHLSNDEAARLLSAAAGSRMQWACLGHLSQDNNEPEVALRTHRRILGDRFPLHIAGRHGPTDVLEI
ncbi:MAG TPA: MBL fold metallo-hydrolase [Thermoguttaceae bacterium]|nr:MBL fold metallo-hydrolase [Thermoguttaceae bacterium]